MTKIKIKIHNAEWFKEHCCYIVNKWKDYLIPKGALWESLDEEADVIHWLLGGEMSNLTGKVLKVKRIDRKKVSAKMNSSRYLAGGYWIPNWAIEWVMEE